MRIRQETDAKLYIQARVLMGSLELCWSYILDYENSHNPFEDRRIAIGKWKYKAAKYYPASEDARALANEFTEVGIAPKDALHVACARLAGCKYFITTDLKLLKKTECGISIINPIDFIRDTEGEE